MIKYLRDKVKGWLGLYDVEDLAIGGHCGCCGDYVEDCIVDKHWQVTLCKKCIEA